MHLLRLHSLPLIFRFHFDLYIFTESLGSKTVTPWMEVGKESENELASAPYVKGVITSTTTQTRRCIQARKGLQATREGGERFGQRESRETGERDTECAPRSNIQSLETKNRTAGAEVGICQSEARSELLLCTPCLHQFSASR